MLLPCVWLAQYKQQLGGPAATAHGYVRSQCSSFSNSDATAQQGQCFATLCVLNVFLLDRRPAAPVHSLRHLLHRLMLVVHGLYVCRPQECAKLGITGTSVGHELKQLAQQLPALFEQLVQQLRSSELDQIIHYYQHFTQYAHGDSPNLAGQQHQTLQEHQLPNVLHLLTEIREGRTVPVSAASTAAAGDNNVVGTGGAAGGGGADLGIDWGGLIDTTAADSSTGGGGVDWSIEAGAAGTADKHATKAATGAGISWDLGDVLPATGGGDGSDAAGISWDVAVEPAADNDDAAAAAAGPSLNWDIDMSGIGVEGGGDSATNAAAPGINWDLQLDTAGVKAEEADRTAGSSSSDASASRLQHDSEYRSQLQDDLLELRAFLISRKAELNNSSSSSNLLRALAPDVVSSTDLGDATRMLTVVDQLLSSLNDSKLKQLLMINSSNRWDGNAWLC